MLKLFKIGLGILGVVYGVLFSGYIIYFVLRRFGVDFGDVPPTLLLDPLIVVGGFLSIIIIYIIMIRPSLKLLTKNGDDNY